ncbi:hypothetical protein B2G94_09885 [Staphylococcus hominis subsp. hominis]|uniref:acyltransferase family protein n=1 Tax=Staphylococcus hominis TaxID=1290 RepID=UPI000B3BA0E8|nr:acyltransferase family protein [Staphylococcus hominis]AUJ52633.1 hypothetical protein B7P03_08545 [Staphylococcus hominis subsp. hominis]OUL45146.1 hypothetical protein B2G94_09885 [Staphylococcus hominis subsp. hominis]
MKYIEEIPIIRSLAILFIMCVHLSVSYAGNENNHSMAIIAGYFSQIGRFDTPVFTVISAFLLTHSFLKRGFDLNYFIKLRFTKTFVPYII